MLEVKKLCFHYKSRLALQDVSANIGSELTAVIGPNAAGKTTFIKCLAGILHPHGAILIEGLLMGKWKKVELTEMLAYLPQQSDDKALLTVFEAVLLGRLSRLTWRVKDEDLDIVMKVLKELSLDHLALRPLNELSGGQQQMVSIAQALAKQPRILLMDEPTNNLDLRRQLEVFEIISDLTRKKDLTTFMAIHDLNFAARFADQLIVLHEGKVHATGSPDHVLTESLLLEVYGVEAKIVYDDTGVPQIIPIRAARNHDFPSIGLPPFGQPRSCNGKHPRKLPSSEVIHDNNHPGTDHGPLEF